MEVGEGVYTSAKLSEGTKQNQEMSNSGEMAVGWLSTKKKGRKHKVLEPPSATRKSLRIQDQGLTMEKKASKLKSIHNLEDPGTPSNPFNVLNLVSSDYLEKVAISCNINLGDNSQSAKEIISSMQAHELVRAALAQAERDKVESSKHETSGLRTENSKRGVSLNIVSSVERGEAFVKRSRNKEKNELQNGGASQDPSVP